MSLSNLPLLDRRGCLRSALALAAGSILASCKIVTSNGESGDDDYTLVLEPHPITLIKGTVTPAWTFNKINPAPILRFKQGQPISINVINNLPEPTTIHWHGIRLDNHADGVPFLTQAPIQPGQSYRYRFTCPDAGTFWYHPHMNSLEQLSRGLVGLIIVEEIQPVAVDGDLPLILKDWHLQEDGSFAAFSDPRAAARTGTLGSFATVNGHQTGSAEATYLLPAEGWCRVRIANVDNTRVYNIACDHPAWVASVEGNPLAEPRSLDQHPLGAGMRVDLIIKMPPLGKEVQIFDMKGRFGFLLCRIQSQPPSQPLVGHRPRLPQNPITPIDVQSARRIPLVFEWAGALSPGFAKTGAQHNDIALSEFWTINNRAWSSHGGTDLPAPLATIEADEHIIFMLHNATPHHHPIHLHGFTFTVLSSDQRDITPYHTDTVLMAKNERMEVAIVADNVGDWMFHCHVIEHMKTGLMGYIRVRPKSSASVS